MSDTTKIVKEQVSPAELAELLDLPGAGNTLLSEEEGKPKFFAKPNDLSFIGQPAKTPKKDPEVQKDLPPADKSEVTSIIEEVLPDPEKKEIEVVTGRPKVSKDLAIEMTKKLIDKKLITPFDDDKPIDDYSAADLEELFEANFKDKEDKVRQQVPVEFFDSLPEEMQYAAQYIANGGKDLKGLFHALGQVQAVRELSPDDPEDHETIVKEYLSVTNFGTPEDIDEEITSWKDLGKLQEKAAKFKPKLDQMREEQVAQRLLRQQEVTRQRTEASRNYQASIYETLRPSEINGIKIDKKTQGLLYTGLIQPQYRALNGEPTNLLGHLLERYQYTEPNYSLIAETLWLLADPEGYRNEIRKQGKNNATEEIVKQLKTQEGRKLASSSVAEREDAPRERKIPRASNFFKR